MYSCTVLTPRMCIALVPHTPFTFHARTRTLGEPRLEQPICEREIHGLDETGDFYEVAL